VVTPYAPTTTEEKILANLSTILLANVTGCVANGAPKELCECSYEKIKSMYSEDDFNKIEKGYVPADFMDKMVESTKLCVLENQ